MKEIILKIIFAISLIFVNVVRFYFQFKYKKNKNSEFKNKFKETLIVFLFYLSFIITSILYIFTDYLSIFYVNLLGIVTFTGILLIIFGTLLFIWTHKTLGKNFSPILEIKKNHELMEKGPYKRIRHPMYSALYITIIGFWLLSSNWVLGILPFLFFSLLYFTRVKKEEKMLIEKFGNKYERYMKNTGRLFPRIFTHQK